MPFGSPSWSCAAALAEPSPPTFVPCGSGTGSSGTCGALREVSILTTHGRTGAQKSQLLPLTPENLRGPSYRR